MWKLALGSKTEKEKRGVAYLSGGTLSLASPLWTALPGGVSGLTSTTLGLLFAQPISACLVRRYQLFPFKPFGSPIRCNSKPDSFCESSAN